MQLEPQVKRQRRLSLTPLIDVVFLLLIFFMLASTFKSFNSLPLAASGTPSQPVAMNKLLLLRVDEKSRITLNGNETALDNLTDGINKLAIADDMVLVVRPHEKTPLKTLVRVLELARASRLKKPVLAR